jgi:hypothetical protein
VQAFLIDLARFVETRGWLVAQDFGRPNGWRAPVAALARQSQQALEEDRHMLGLADADR